MGLYTFSGCFSLIDRPLGPSDVRGSDACLDFLGLNDASSSLLSPDLFLGFDFLSFDSQSFDPKASKKHCRM